MNVKKYDGVSANIDQLVEELRIFFNTSRYDVQTIPEPSGVVVQARKSGRLRDLTGQSHALTVRISVDQLGTRVEIGRQKWLTKAAVAGAGLLLGPLAFVAFSAAGAGAYWQYQVTEDTWNVIDKHMMRVTGGIVSRAY